MEASEEKAGKCEVMWWQRGRRSRTTALNLSNAKRPRSAFECFANTEFKHKCEVKLGREELKKVTMEAWGRLGEEDKKRFVRDADREKAEFLEGLLPATGKSAAKVQGNMEIKQ